MSTQLTTQPEIKWYKDVSKNGWKALFAAGLGWLFEVYYVYVLSLTLPAIMFYFHLTKAQGGMLGSIEALGLIIGGIVNGWLADRIGRVKALFWSIVVYSVFTGITAFVSGVTALALLRFLAGLGMGGEWVAGAALVAETWGPKNRGKGGAIMQAGLPVGSLIAIGVSAIITAATGTMNNDSWKIMYLLSFVELILAFYVILRTPESPLWLEGKAKKTERSNLSDLVAEGQLPRLAISFLFVFFLQYVYWAVFTWVPTFLVSVKHMSFVKSLSFTLTQQLGSLIGFLIFAILVDKIGRKMTFILYLVIGALAMVVFTYVENASVLLVASFFTGFGITGLFAGLEMMPKGRSRGLAMGIAYNGGRFGGFIAPYVVGSLATSSAGFQIGMMSTVVAFVLAIIVMLASKETKGTILQ